MRFSQLFEGGPTPPDKPTAKPASPAAMAAPVPSAPAPLPQRPTAVPPHPSAQQAAELLYLEALGTVRQLVQLAGAGQPVTALPLPELVQKIVTQLEQNNALLYLTGRSTDDNYLIGHIVNVAILSLTTARSLNYDAAKLRGLGICAILYDLGMAKLLNLAATPHKLSGEAFKEIKQHTQYSVELLKSWGIDWEGVTEVAQQHHERADGSGYPAGLKAGSIHEWAKLIGLIDVYESLTHPRAHRQQPTPAAHVIAALLSSRDLFEAKYLRALLDQISLYPVGTWVKLSSGEYGQVSEVTPGMPMRPVVSVQYDSQHHRLPAPRHINLHEQMSILVEKVLDGDAIAKLLGGMAHG